MTGFDQQLLDLARQTGAGLLAAGQTLVSAESCTGGGIMHLLTAISGSSGWCEGGFITYSNRAKTSFIGVPEQTLQQYGAVSEDTVKAMAAGALDMSDASVSVAVSGIAGPDGGSAEKPVGTVWIAWRQKGKPAQAEHFVFAGDREAVRRQTIVKALEGVISRCAVPEKNN